MSFRFYLAPAFATVLFAVGAAAPASAAPVQKAVFSAGDAQMTLVDYRDGRRGGDHRGDRNWRGNDRGRDRGHYRGNYGRSYSRPYRAPRYVYAPPPAYYYPYDGYSAYDPYYPNTGYFSYSSPGFGFSLGY